MLSSSFLWKGELHLHVTQFSWNQCFCEFGLVNYALFFRAVPDALLHVFLTETASQVAPHVLVGFFFFFKNANVALSRGMTKFQGNVGGALSVVRSKVVASSERKSSWYYRLSQTSIVAFFPIYENSTPMLRSLLARPCSLGFVST